MSQHPLWRFGKGSSFRQFNGKSHRRCISYMFTELPVCLELRFTEPLVRRRLIRIHWVSQSITLHIQGFVTRQACSAIDQCATWAIRINNLTQHHMCRGGRVSQTIEIYVNLDSEIDPAPFNRNRQSLHH